ncbi:hypothetical protein HUN27_22030 [Agrobacterium tumefaciens]|nr:hypothetical protein [Agrobacterium tumefaciens]
MTSLRCHLCFVFAIELTVLPQIASAEVFYKYGEAQIFDGRYGPIADAQAAANQALSDCGIQTTITVDGKFGPNTQNALRRLANCDQIASKLENDPEAHTGAITRKYWAALLDTTAVPTVDNRAHSLMLTYEVTDYIRMEWNYCQSKPLFDPSKGNTVCYSNDPRSYITWGPNGATAGGGREVQLILQAVDRASSNIIEASFRSEAVAIRRMFKMSDRDNQRSLETFLCGVWNDRARRAAWKEGFQRVGQERLVREKFDELYRSRSLDGGKIASFYRAYSSNGLKPTEVDYGFFKDRAAHTSVNYDRVNTAIADFLAANPHAKPWQVRRAIALNIRPSNQRADRLGRDVAFYIDGGEAYLTQEERAAWQHRGRLRASDVGLADERNYATFTPEPVIDTTILQPATLTQAEKNACPAAILATQHPN